MKKYIARIVLPIFNKIYGYYKEREEIIQNKNKEITIQKFQSIGAHFHLNGVNHFFSSPDKIIIGNNVHIEDNAYFKTEGGLIIGNNTHISKNVTIFTVNNNYEGKSLPHDNIPVYKPVIIGENVFIGMNASISFGVTIGDGAIIEIGTVVNRDVAPLEIVGPAKAITIDKRNLNHYSNLNSNKAFSGVNGSLLNKSQIESFLPSYNQNRLKPIVFVLGTGRSGTVSITKIFNQHPNCKAFHEDVYQLIRLSTHLEYNKNKDVIYKELKAILNTKIWNAAESQVIVHSDQRLWNFIPFLSNYFPNSKFIHLVREPKSCIKSMVLRNWYQDNEYPNYSIWDWAKYRLRGDLVNAFSVEEWAKMSNVKKCAWYYYHINTRIANDLNKLNSSRRLSIKLEDLNDDFDKVLEFLNLKKMDLEIFKSNIIRKKDRLRAKEMNINSLISEIDEAIKLYDI
ncbi:sulfotransferase [Winogradskyella sp. ECml5-4]|uniref:sulfotransferase n=1 Tax=Winogradskyella sp. ECml5-4 TaxID=3110975 RepID=UPI002FF1CAFB